MSAAGDRGVQQHHGMVGRTAPAAGTGTRSLAAMSLIFATQLTAVATAALAVFAIVTAVYAVRAFRKQGRW